MQLHKRINSEKLRESCRVFISADILISFYSHESTLPSYFFYREQSSTLVLRQHQHPSRRYSHNFVLLRVQTRLGEAHLPTHSQSP